MARPLRIEFPGALYHVTARGNGRRAIYLDDRDREFFLGVLAATVARYGWRCHAYCLMPNHYHLVVETPYPNLARGMRHLNGVYAQSFNARHARTGHVFGGRYKAILVDREAHLLELCRYVVLNPLRTRRRQPPTRWAEWTSYPETAGMRPAPGFLTVNWVLRQFGDTRASAQARYREFVCDRVPTPWRELVGEIYLGRKPFVRQRAKRGGRSPEHPRRQREPLAHRLEALLRAELNRAVTQAHREHRYTLRELAEELGIHYSTVSRRLKKLEASTSND